MTDARISLKAALPLLGVPERTARAMEHSFASRSRDLLRVAAAQLPRLTPEERAALRPYVERDLHMVERSR